MGGLLLWEGNGTQVKFLPLKKQMRRCAGGEKKKNAVEYNLHSWKRESIFLIIGILENARDRWRSEKHRSNNSVDSFKTVDRCRS